jgi:hypothetical protein
LVLAQATAYAIAALIGSLPSAYDLDEMFGPALAAAAIALPIGVAATLAVVFVGPAPNLRRRLAFQAFSLRKLVIAWKGLALGLLLGAVLAGASVAATGSSPRAAFVATIGIALGAFAGVLAVLLVVVPISMLLAAAQPYDLYSPTDVSPSVMSNGELVGGAAILLSTALFLFGGVYFLLQHQPGAALALLLIVIVVATLSVPAANRATRGRIALGVVTPWDRGLLDNFNHDLLPEAPGDRVVLPPQPQTPFAPPVDFDA